MCSCLRGVSRWFTPLACGPGSPELSKSYMDMASKLFTLTFTTASTRSCTIRAAPACSTETPLHQPLFKAVPLSPGFTGQTSTTDNSRPSTMNSNSSQTGRHACGLMGTANCSWHQLAHIASTHTHARHACCRHDSLVRVRCPHNRGAECPHVRHTHPQLRRQPQYSTQHRPCVQMHFGMHVGGCSRVLHASLS